MEGEKKLRLLQAMYAGALADSALRLGREGIIEKVAAEKRREQMAGGKARAAQLAIREPREVFEVLPEVFGCADWKVEATGEGFEAAASRCMLCVLAKRMGAPCPCRIYCLDAMEGMVRGLDERAAYHVLSTLWDGSECRVAVKTYEAGGA